MLFKLANLERKTHNLVVLGHSAFGELGTQITCKLAIVEFAHNNLLVFAQDIAGVLRQRADVVEVSVSHFLAFLVHLLGGEGEGATGATPANDEQVSVGIAGNLLVGDVVGDAVNLFLTVVGHRSVVLGIGAERAVGAFLEAAYAVTETFHAWESPFASESLGIAAERTEIGVVGLSQTRSDGGQIGNLGDAEEL